MWSVGVRELSSSALMISLVCFHSCLTALMVFTFSEESGVLNFFLLWNGNIIHPAICAGGNPGWTEREHLVIKGHTLYPFSGLYLSPQTPAAQPRIVNNPRSPRKLYRSPQNNTFAVFILQRKRRVFGFQQQMMLCCTFQMFGRGQTPDWGCCH